MTGSYGRVVVNFSDCSKVNKIFGNEIRKYSNYFTQSRRRGSCKNCDCMLIKEFIVRRAKLICFFLRINALLYRVQHRLLFLRTNN